MRSLKPIAMLPFNLASIAVLIKDSASSILHPVHTHVWLLFTPVGGTGLRALFAYPVLG